MKAHTYSSFDNAILRTSDQHETLDFQEVGQFRRVELPHTDSVAFLVGFSQDSPEMGYQGEIGRYGIGSLMSIFSMHKWRNGNVPTPSVPTRIPKTSASRAFWTVAYRFMRSLFTLADSKRVDLVGGS